ncbi:MAG: hypothetical protein HS122_04265 [Opitutaceae bacterium]|nr:hypothetical protein [Opitutaceae bacterium]
MNLQTLIVAGASGLALGLSACSSVQDRMDRDPSTYAGSSREDQALIRNGKVAVGFTREQVRMALGDPTGVATRTTAEGSQEVWSYHDKGPKFGLGVGVGGGSGGVGVGVGVGTGDRSDEPRMRIIFSADRVVSVEQHAK